MNSSRPGSRVSPLASALATGSAAGRARPSESAPGTAPARRRALAAAPAALLGAALLAACGQAPGETGLAYVEQQGIRVTAPLYHLSFDDLPADSAFGTEVPLNHYGESLLVVGRESDYVARARLGFQLTSKAQRDSLAKGLHLRLATLPPSGVLAGGEWLRQTGRGRDSLTLLVQSFSWVDSTGSYAETLGVLHRRIISTPVPFSTLDPRYLRLDTIKVSPYAAYHTDSGVAVDTSQAGALPNLHQRLTTGFGSDSTRRWVVFLEISPLTTADSGMFRFIGQAAASSGTILRRYNSGLWLGRYSEDSLLTVGTLVTPYRSGFAGTPATNYETRHTGASTNSLLYGVARGLHIRINRDTLIARIRLKLNALEPGLGDRYLDSGYAATGNFDRRFYIPYAAMRLPVDTALTRVDGSFALDMSVATDVDSLGVDTAAFRGDVAIAVDDSLRLTVHGGRGAVSVDTLAVAYRRHPVDTSLRQVLTRWAGDAKAADTFITAPDGRHRELTLTRRAGWRRAATLSVKPGAEALGVEVYFNTAGVLEPRDMVDADGDPVTSLPVLSRRFLRPGADSLSVRVTRGMQNLLNRKHVPGVGIAPDFFLRGVDRAAYDTSRIVDFPSTSRVIYPVFGEVGFKRTGGRLVVGLELYLYPLEAGR